MASKGTVLVAGAGGLVGRATIDQYRAEGGWDVVALSRRAPEPPTGAAHLAVDLANVGVEVPDDLDAVDDDAEDPDLRLVRA